MELYQASQEAVLRSRTLFSNIYKELNKKSKNFSPGLIEEKSKTRDFATSIQWLTLARIVNQSFQLKAHKLFYRRGKATAELEFIVESDNKLYPIDVKKGRGTLNSLEKFSNHNKFELAIKVSKSNYGYNAEQKLLTVTFYFIPFLAQDLAEGKQLI